MIREDAQGLAGFGHHSCWTNHKVLLRVLCGRSEKGNDSSRFQFKIQGVKTQEYLTASFAPLLLKWKLQRSRQYSRQSWEKNHLSANTICSLRIMTHFDVMLFCSTLTAFLFFICSNIGPYSRWINEIISPFTICQSHKTRGTSKILLFDREGNLLKL